MRLAVIGCGYVGLVSAACLAEIGHEVISVDTDLEKIAELNRGEVPIHEHLLPQLLERHRGKRLKFSSSVGDAVKQSEAVFITVGTPDSGGGEPDMSAVEAVAAEIAGSISEPKLIVEKSTVPVCTCESIRKVLLLHGAGTGRFSVASNPEFLREGTAVTDFLYPDRIVLGVDDDFSAAMLYSIYRPLTEGAYYRQAGVIPGPHAKAEPARVIVTNAKSAELIKHAANAFLAMKISYINMVANIAEAVGADIDQVCTGLGADARIGPQFLQAGIGYGGSCFPKDVAAFQNVAFQCGIDFALLSEVTRINLEQQRQFVKKVRAALWTLRNKRLGVLGLAFKGGTDDVRESPAIAIVRELLKEGAQVCAYDPAAMVKAREVLPAGAIEYAENEYQAAARRDALLLLTDWPQFARLDLHKLRTVMKLPIILDGRNLFNPNQMAAAGFLYYSVGRALRVTETMPNLWHGVRFAPQAVPVMTARPEGLPV
ncbi:MAG TPA: UDP-glucose/GDP-mannose dehydrogenase family protein [Terriglobales bacterium]|nr:UDP-glucose/GDP-mannose dehydrogenase family protein [Terriglobales bacterium]